MSHYDLDLWPLDLGSLWWIWCHMVIVCSKFDQNRTVPGWVILNLANFCPHYVSLWSWSLTHWPWSFVVLWVSCVQTLYKIRVKSNNPWQNYWRYHTFSPSNCRGRALSLDGSQGCIDVTSSNLQRTQGDHRHVRNLFQNSNILLRFEMRAAQSQMVSKLAFEVRRKWRAVGNFGFNLKWILTIPQPL